MVEGEFQDIPPAFRKDVDAVYNVLGLMPEAWGNPVSPPYRRVCLT